MPLLSPDFWEKIKQKVQGIGSVNRSWTNPDQRPLAPIDIPPDMSDLDTKGYVQQMVGKPAEDIPQGGFENKTADYAEPRKIIWDYQDKAPFPEQYRGYLTESADQYGLDPNILASLIASESGGAGYQADLPGADGEIGIAQIIPKLFYQQAGFNSPEEYARALQDPAFSIEQAAIIIKDLLEDYQGNYYDALASYNGGPTGYQESGYGADYARDTLNRIGMLDQYQPTYLAQGY